MEKGNTIENLRFNSCHMHCILCTMCVWPFLSGNNNFIVNNSEQWPLDQERERNTNDGFFYKKSIICGLPNRFASFNWFDDILLIAYKCCCVNNMNRRRDRRSITRFSGLCHIVVCTKRFYIEFGFYLPVIFIVKSNPIKQSRWWITSADYNNNKYIDGWIGTVVLNLRYCGVCKPMPIKGASVFRLLDAWKPNNKASFARRIHKKNNTNTQHLDNKQMKIWIVSKSEGRDKYTIWRFGQKIESATKEPSKKIRNLKQKQHLKDWLKKCFELVLHLDRSH